LARAFPCYKVHIRRPGAKGNQRWLDPRQRLALLSAVLFNGLCLAGLGWGVYARQAKGGENAEILLQAGSSSFKLNKTSAEPVSLEMPAAIITQEPVERISEAPPTMSVAPPPLAEPPCLAQVDSIPLALDWEPILVFSSNHAHHQGDSPMLRNWKSLELATLLAAAFTAQPVLFAGEGGKKDVDAKAVLERLEIMHKATAKTLGEITKDLTFLKGDHVVMQEELKNKIGKVEEKLAKLQSDLEKLKKQDPSINPIDKANFEEIRNRLGQIEQTIAKMQAPSRIALAPPNTGRIMLVNLYPEELLFVINGRTYRVPANRTMPLESHPAGTFTYEVIAPRFYGRVAQKTSTLDPNETYTITAR